jgi:pilus assembly protein CpaB
LRALVDANAPAPVEDPNGGKRDSISIVRYGIPSTATITK